MQILVLGAGWMGRAAVFDLLSNPKLEKVTLVDSDAKQLKDVEKFLNAPNELRIKYKKADIDDAEAVAKLMAGHDTVLSAVPYRYNFKLAKLAVQNGCNFCDLGGNNTIVDEELSLDDKAAKKGVTIVPDCGLAPGMVAVLVADGMTLFDSVEDVHIRVGGLPVEPKPPMNYKLVFSVGGLINEYVEPCIKIKDGKVITEEPLIDVEELEFPEPFGMLEAFNTSGGTSTLPKTYLGKVKNLDYKTIRYPGHCAQFKTLMDLGLMDDKPLKVGGSRIIPRELLSQLLIEKLTMGGKDSVLVRVEMTGKKDGSSRTVRYQIIDYGDELNKLTAMMRLTSFPISVVAQMLSDGTITKKGACPQEVCVPPAKFISELEKKGIRIEKTVS